MKAEILTIGDEVLAGNILDSNTTFLAEQLWLNGIVVTHHSAVRDIKEDIIAALKLALSRVDCLFVTGGLGPTEDDLTIAAANAFFGTNLVCDEAALGHLEFCYKSMGRIPTENNRRQAYIPEGGRTFINKHGTAPGICFIHQGKPVYFMPGVPKEMKTLFLDAMLPDLLAHQKEKVFFKHILLKCFGAAESELDRSLKDLYTAHLEISGVRVGFRVSYPETFIKLSTWDSKEDAAEKKLEQAIALVKEKIGIYYYGQGDDTLESVVGALLVKSGKTLSVAESCTGGLLGHRLTNISGSSGYFLGGVLSYSNEIKNNILKVSQDTLKLYGAVSEACAGEMALGVQKLAKSDYALSITGIAGPTGGNDEKPVGLVYIALATPNGVSVKKNMIKRSREQFKLMAASMALNWLRRELLGE